MRKKLIYILILVVLLGAGWLLKQEFDQILRQTQTSKESTAKAEPTFLVGQISKLEGDRVYFTVSVPTLDASGKQVVVYEDRVAVVSSQTKILVQSTTKDKKVSVSEGRVDSLKTGMQIAVYYYPENALKGEILAEKIQVIQ